MSYSCSTCNKIHETEEICPEPIPDIVNKLTKCKAALWTIVTDYHEDNPGRHLNSTSAWQVATQALIEIGELKDEP